VTVFADLTARLVRDIDRLCGPGDRHPGTQRNRDATAYVAGCMRELGLEVEVLQFDVPEWR
jgi:hypothetical protein